MIPEIHIVGLVTWLEPAALVTAQAEVGGSYYVPPKEPPCNHQEYIPLTHFSEVPTQTLQAPISQIGHLGS